MHPLDWAVVVVFCVCVFGIGVLMARRASRGVEDYFASGRNLAWWMAGTSMVATTFGADTPLLVTGYVRGSGIWANWAWWGFLVSHVAVAFFFARWWKRSGVLTEVELAELRYDGRGAAILRGSKAVLWGGVYNVFVAGGLPMLGMVKILQVVLEMDGRGDIPLVDPKLVAVGIALALAIFYSVLSGFWGVVVTDLFQFGIAMVGAVVLAVLAVVEVGGVDALTASERVAPHLHYLPAIPEAGFFGSDFALVLSFVFIQWWAFKNADGGGILVQRMVASRDERHAVGAALWFNLAHYVLRTWPWIVVGLASIVLLPALEDPEKAYPMLAMRLLPPVLRGLVVASFFAAFMSTMDTHINWGASYMVHDLYRRFLRPQADERECVRISRLVSILVAVGAVLVAIHVESVRTVFETVLLLTAGIGTVLLGRWLWWRTNAWAEIACMAVSVPAGFFARDSVEWLFGLDGGGRLAELLWTACSTGAVWIGVALLTRPAAMDRLVEFYRRVRPPRWGWGPVARRAAAAEEVPEDRFGRNLALWIMGVVSLAGLNLAGVTLLQGDLPRGLGLAGLCAALGCMIMKHVTGRRALNRIGGSVLVASAFMMSLLGWFEMETLAALFAGLALTGEQTIPTLVLGDDGPKSV